MDLIQQEIETGVMEEIAAIEKPMLNLGCGKILLPCDRPDHHHLVDADIYDHPTWLNVDVSPNVGADEVVDVFRYPWPWPDDSFSGALLSHLAEHIPHHIFTTPWIPHDIEHAEYIQALPDGFYAFFAELRRVLEPDAIVHILSPYGLSLADPTHTRPIVPATFGYLSPDEDAPFAKDYGSHFEVDNNPVIQYQNTGLIGTSQIATPVEFSIQLRAVKT